MDVRELLHSVAEAYRNLKSLEAELLCVHEDRSEGSVNRSEQLVEVAYEAPNRIRVQSGKGRGVTTVCDGTWFHHYFAPPNHYRKNPAPPPEQLPGAFRPEFPMSAGGASTFLFARIDERVADAQLLRRDVLRVGDADVRCDVVSVTYEPGPYRSFYLSQSPLTFWFDVETRLVMRQEFEGVMIHSHDDERHATADSTTITRFTPNQPIPASRFEFTPPRDAMDLSDPLGRGACVTVGGGGGSRYGRGAKESANWHTHAWAGQTLVEQSKWTFRGHELTFERRLTLSDDGKEVRVAERVIGPKDEATHELSIPVA